MYRRIAAFAALAAVAACSAPRGASPLGPAVPAAPVSAVRPEAAHAPCTIVAGLKSPVAGQIALLRAYGQLIASPKGAYSAYPGLLISVAAGKRVFAATSGTATYYANRPGFGNTLVVVAPSGIQTLYANLGSLTLKLSSKHTAAVKAGQAMALTGKAPLRFEYSASGSVLAAGAQSNPCGSGSSGAVATLNVLPATAAVLGRFHAVSVNGVPVAAGQYASPGFPANQPDVVTPAAIATANVASPATVTASVIERSDVFDNYYVVLCGNAVFATGNPRYAGPFAYGQDAIEESPALPPVVFFRDAGAQGAALTKPLPAPYGNPCPAPNPAFVYAGAPGAPTFYMNGQSEFLWYWCSATPDTISLASTNVAAATVSPSPLTVNPSPAPPNWPPPPYHADVTAVAPGIASITASDQQCGQFNDGSITVTVLATPSPAPVPTPLPN